MLELTENYHHKFSTDWFLPSLLSSSHDFASILIATHLCATEISHKAIHQYIQEILDALIAVYEDHPSILEDNIAFLLKEIIFAIDKNYSSLDEHRNAIINKILLYVEKCSFEDMNLLIKQISFLINNPHLPPELSRENYPYLEILAKALPYKESQNTTIYFCLALIKVYFPKAGALLEAAILENYLSETPFTAQSIYQALYFSINLTLEQDPIKNLFGKEIEENIARDIKTYIACADEISLLSNDDLELLKKIILYCPAREKLNIGSSLWYELLHAENIDSILEAFTKIAEKLATQKKEAAIFLIEEALDISDVIDSEESPEKPDDYDAKIITLKAMLVKLKEQNVPREADESAYVSLTTEKEIFVFIHSSEWQKSLKEALAVSSPDCDESSLCEHLSPLIPKIILALQKTPENSSEERIESLLNPITAVLIKIFLALGIPVSHAYNFELDILWLCHTTLVAIRKDGRDPYIAIYSSTLEKQLEEYIPESLKRRLDTPMVSEAKKSREEEKNQNSTSEESSFDDTHNTSNGMGGTKRSIQPPTETAKKPREAQDTLSAEPISDLGNQLRY